MTDQILLGGLRIMAICGALPEEKVRAQPFDFDVAVHTDISAAGASDELDDTIDYGAMTDQIVSVITGSEWTLLERMATVVADTVLAEPRASGVTVEVRKVRPPVPHSLDTSGVRITRTR